MAGFRQYLRPEIMASAIAHLSIVALVFVYAEAHPFGSVPTQSVNVDIVTPDEIEQKPEPAPSPSPQLPTDLSALTKPAETPPPAAQTPSPPPTGRACQSQGGGGPAAAGTVAGATAAAATSADIAATEPGPRAIAVNRLCATRAGRHRQI